MNVRSIIERNGAALIYCCLRAGLLLIFGTMTACDRRSGSTTGTAVIPETPHEDPSLADVTENVGLRFSHRAGGQDDYFMPASMGSGGALLDYDNDGRLDIYLIQNGGPDGPPNQLYHQEPDGTFKNVSAGSGIDVSGYGMGVAVGDVNNDGLPDVLVTEYGRIRLFLNLGGGHFKDVSQEAGIEDIQWATSAAFVDYDRDGWLDLVVVNYLDYSPDRKCPTPKGTPDFCGPSWFPGTPSRLFHNRGAAPSTGEQPSMPRFDDVTLPSGLASRPGRGLGIYCGDFDGDGWPDLLIANDLQLNHLWINHHDGIFVEEATRRGIASDALAAREANMGIAVGDVRGTGMFDVFITHLTEQRHILWRQTATGLFQDATDAARLATSPRHGTGWGTAFVDLHNNGHLDLLIGNGRVVRSTGGNATPNFWDAYAERNEIFASEDNGRFKDISGSNPDFCDKPNVARGLACGDVFNDGGTAVLICNAGGPARLYRDVAPHRGHWLDVRAVEPQHGGRDAYAARITLTTADGKRVTAWANPGYSYLTSNDPRAHFGLADATAYSQLEVDWPDGTNHRFPGGEVDRIVTLAERSLTNPTSVPAAATTVP